MKSKKFVSLLLAACLSLSAMTVNAWAENGGENKEVPAPVVQEVEGEDKKDQETKPEEPKTEETGEGEDKKDQETNEGENKETNKDETKETDKDENKAGEGEDKKNEETKPADPSAAVAYGTAAVAMALNNGNSNPPVDNESFSEPTIIVEKHVVTEGLTEEQQKDLVDTLRRELAITVKGIDDPFRPADLSDENETETNNGVTWKWEPQPFGGTVTAEDVKETGNEVEGYNLSMLGIDVKKETSTSTTVIVTNYYTKKQTPGPGPEQPTGASFTIVKVDKADTTKKLAGATFNLYREADHALIQKVTTNANGEAEFKEIPPGKYLLTEIQAPADYQNSNSFYTVQVTENNGKFEVSIEPLRNLDESGGYVFQITNTKTQTAGNFTIVKVDKEVTTKKLAGATFTLTALNENGEPASEPDYEKTTDANGEAKFENVPLGKYILKETVAPHGYQLPVDVTYEVVVNESTLYIEGGVLMSDGTNFYIPNTQLPTPTTGSFTITKVDAANHDLKLTGAQFTLKKDGYVQTRTSDQGIAAFYDVPVGTYTLTETVAPQGYVTPNEYYTVKVNENGKISVWKVTAPSEGGLIVPLPDHFINQNPGGNVEVKDKNFVVTNKQVVPNPDPKPDDRPTYRYDDDDDFVLPTVTRKDNKKPANKPERAPRVEEVIPSKRNPETGNSSSMPIAMAAAAVSLTGLVVLCKKKDK